MCGGLYLENDAELEEKKKVSFVAFPLFKTYILTWFCSASIYHQRDWKDDVFVEENSFIVMALKSGYPLIKSLIKHLQQKTGPLRELMVSSNIWFYSNSVLPDGHTSYNCKDSARINEAQPWTLPWMNIGASSLVLLLGFTGNFTHTFYDRRRGESTAVWPRHGRVD